MLNRVPLGQNDGLESVDDYYGVLDGCKTLKVTSIPRTFLKALFRNLGFMNNVDRTKIWSAFLPRQPQLIAAMISTSFPSLLNTIHWLIRLLAFPLYLWTSIVIFISCIGVSTNDTDDRRLAWHLIQTVTPVSMLCKLASSVWFYRLYSNYGATGMRAVAKIYYQQNHPFAKYWVT